MQLGIYKRGQGKYTRLGTAAGGSAAVAIGCWQLYRTLEAQDVNLWIETMVPVGLFVLVSFFMLWLVNKPNVADFMIAAEGEMKKVNWSSKQEIAVSTVVVISVVIILAVILGTADYVFQVIITWMLL